MTIRTRAQFPGLCAVLFSTLQPAAQEAASLLDAPRVAIQEKASIDCLLDLDGDGRMDGVGFYWTTSTGDKATLFGHRNDGKGRFTEIWNQPLPFSKRIDSWDLKAGRFDRVQGDDFVVAVNNSATVYRSGPGGKPQIYTSVTIAGAIHAVGVLDLDRDGLDDLVLGGTGVHLYRNTGTGFQLVDTDTRAVQELKLGEFDGDGTPDVVIRDGTQLSILGSRNKLGEIYRGVTGVASNIAQMLVVGDIDGDKDDDVCVFGGDGRYTVLRQTAPGQLAREGLRVGGPATGLADIDGDGDLDGVCCGGGGGPITAYNRGRSTFHLSLNDGRGNFAVAWQVHGVGGKRLAGAADIDGDGDTDLVAGRSVFFNQRSFDRDPSPFNRQAGAMPDVLLPVDIDADGDLDMVHGRELVWRNDGTGQLQAWPTELPALPQGDVYHGAGFAGDWDGDGDQDLLVGIYRAATGFEGMHLMRNTGGGFLDAGLACAGRVWFQPEPVYSFNHGGFSFPADIDGDGDLDLVAGSRDKLQKIYLWRNDGKGFFTWSGEVAATRPHVVRDMDGDGKPDLVAWDPAFTLSSVSGVAVFFNDGFGNFVNRVFLGTTIALQDRIAVADLDGDGLPEVIAQRGGPSKQLDIWDNLGRRQFAVRSLTPGLDITRTAAPSRVLAGDLDGDGDQDLVVSNVENADGASLVLHNDGSGSFRVVVQAVDATTLADLDGDGDLDAVGVHVARGARFAGKPAGGIRQYGLAVQGQGGMEPRLGAVGPLRVGERMELRLGGARPAAPALLLLGMSSGKLTGWPTSSGTLLVDQILLGAGLVTSSGPSAGEGSVVLPFIVPAAARGLEVFCQAFVLDAGAAGGVSQTAGLQSWIGG